MVSVENNGDIPSNKIHKKHNLTYAYGTGTITEKAKGQV